MAEDKIKETVSVVTFEKEEIKWDLPHSEIIDI